MHSTTAIKRVLHLFFLTATLLFSAMIPLRAQTMVDDTKVWIDEWKYDICWHVAARNTNPLLAESSSVLRPDPGDQYDRAPSWNSILSPLTLLTLSPGRSR
jgi:hypothetical protein